MSHIVVGIDGSEPSKRALAFAIEEAQYRRTDVHATLVWHYFEQTGGRDGFRPDYGEDDAKAILQAVVDEVAGTSPTVQIIQTTVQDLPARGLIDACSGAAMLVVGDRGKGGFRGLLLGSVSQQLAHHAPVPLVIIRGSAG